MSNYEDRIGKEVIVRQYNYFTCIWEYKHGLIVGLSNDIGLGTFMVYFFDTKELKEIYGLDILNEEYPVTPNAEIQYKLKNICI